MDGRGGGPQLSEMALQVVTTVTTNSGRWCDEWERKEKRKKKEEEREIKEKKGKKEEGDEGREVWRKEGRREGKNGPHYKWGQ